MKKRILLSLLVLLGSLRPLLAVDADPTLFESTDVIRKYLEGATKYNYKDFKLTRVSLEFIKDPSRTGLAYVYFFNHREGGMRPGYTIYHFMDGTITEGTFGP
jgi:hypothetical protein